MQKRICKDFETKDFGDYRNLYPKSHTLLLADVFEKFRKMLLEIYQLDLTRFLSTPELPQQTAYK